MKDYKTFESTIIGKVQVFKYKVVKTEPIENLEKYKNHRRLKVFYHKGLKCVNYAVCGREGQIITHGIDNGGGLHKDVCTADFYPMTIDHIIPRSKGGKDTLKNLDPMCSGCNARKGNALEGDDEKNGERHENTYYTKRAHLKGAQKQYDIEIGDVVYKNKTHEFLGKVVDIRPNYQHPHNIMSAEIEERDSESLYSLGNLYKV
jgi:5-methylcytosine-specific restriction endonuclease McrA